MARDMIDDMIAREDEEDSQAVPYVFGRGKRRVYLTATTLEYAWSGLEARIGDDADVDDWTLLTIDGEPVD